MRPGADHAQARFTCAIDVLEAGDVHQVDELFVREVRQREGVPVVQRAVMKDPDDFAASWLAAKDVAQVVVYGSARGRLAQVPRGANQATHGFGEALARHYASGGIGRT
jgi:hypothetical protein